MVVFEIFCKYMNNLSYYNDITRFFEKFFVVRVNSSA